MQTISDNITSRERNFRRGRGLAVLAGVALAPLLFGALTIHPGASVIASFEPHAMPASACAAWHQLARSAVADLAPSGVAPARIEDAKFRLRRAERNCAAGWIELACRDYQALLDGPLPPGDGKRHTLAHGKSCGLTTAGNDLTSRGARLGP